MLPGANLEPVSTSTPVLEMLMSCSSSPHETLMPDNHGTSPRPFLSATRRSSRTRSHSCAMAASFDSNGVPLSDLTRATEECCAVDDRRLGISEHRRVFDPRLARTLETVHDLRGHHAAIVLKAQRHRFAVEDRPKEAARPRCFRGRVRQHVERRHGQHLNVGRRVELLHVGKQLGFVRRREQRRRDDQIRRPVGDRGNGLLH